MRLIGKLLALPFVVVTGILYLVCKFLVVVSGAVLRSRVLAGAFMAGDCVPDQPLRSANGGGLAGGDHRRRKQRVKGFCIWLNSFGGAHWQPRPFSIIMAVCYGGFLIGGISLKDTTLNNGIQKVNDVMGNPVIIGAVVIWKVIDPTKAVFNVEDYTEFLSIQTDSTIRNISRMYPYDLLQTEEHENSTEKTLRGSAQEIADNMKTELSKKVEFAGLEIQEVRITHLSYAEEIAAAMLRRQQAEAVIAARAKIVDGAVSMVKMAIDKLGEEEVVILDEERKAAMVSNLMVVLCSEKDTQPIVNSGSIY